MVVDLICKLKYFYKYHLVVSCGDNFTIAKKIKYYLNLKPKPLLFMNIFSVINNIEN